MTPIPDSISEKMWQAKVVAAAKWLGWSVYHTHDSRRSEPGFPDLVLVRDDRLMFAELKSATGRVTKAQREWLDRLAVCAECHVWRPNEWSTVLAALQR
jgi:hypothetical protein